PPLEGAWIEALTGRVRLGPVLLPFMTVAGLQLDGQLHHFAGPRALLGAEVALDTRSLQLSVRRGRDRLQVALHAAHFAGLRYQDPDGQDLACLNSKLAEGRITLQQGGRERVLYTRQAALEIGTREPGHGVALLA
ncbi:MAG TPA: hypothetical protein VFX59_31580, partial [Polyangiales bacterium]|nr:hypothetical protein [Polyangiales bacterium]